LTCKNSVCTGCGTESEPCCNGSCGSGLACIGEQCVKCGGQSQPCCGGQCGSGLACIGDQCTACGGGDQPCCEGLCNSTSLFCDNGTCHGCGTQNAPCCPGGGCGGGALLRCWNGSCQPCGSFHLLCCQDGSCDSSTICDGTTCRQCCASCKNFGVITVPLYVCQQGTYSDICRNKNNCGTTNKDPCCAAGTCTNPNGNGACN
jgi:hypothetical protein